MEGGWESQAEEKEGVQDGALTQDGARPSLLGSLNSHLAAPSTRVAALDLALRSLACLERPYLHSPLCSASRKEVAPVARGWDIPWLGLLFPDFS